MSGGNYVDGARGALPRYLLHRISVAPKFKTPRTPMGSAFRQERGWGIVQCGQTACPSGAGGAARAERGGAGGCADSDFDASGHAPLPACFIVVKLLGHLESALRRL